MKIMKIKKIEVRNLFGIFDHIVELNLEEEITIIHGPNGFGKTIILKLTKNCLSRISTIFYQIPFTKFQITFDDNRFLLIEKISLNSNTLRLSSSWTTKVEKIKRFNIKDTQFPISMLESFIPILEYLGNGKFRNKRTREILSIEDCLLQYNQTIIESGFLPEKYIKDFVSMRNFIPEEVSNSINVHLIETQRLIYKGRSLSHSRITEKASRSFISAVKQYSFDLINEIKNVKAKYGELSQSKDRTFPRRLMMKDAIKTLDSKDLQKKLGELETNRERLRNLGLLDMEEEEFQISEIDKGSEKVLSVYISDVKEKLDTFESLAQKIELFQKIMNDHFLYKKLSIDKEKGFIIFDVNKKEIQPDTLSSGEQHELVLLYELLFKVKENSLIMIDEPEISLHVAWQKQFLKDIQEISKTRKLSIIIATHSPLIINERWDLTVELEGIKDARSD